MPSRHVLLASSLVFLATPVVGQDVVMRRPLPAKAVASTQDGCAPGVNCPTPTTSPIPTISPTPTSTLPTDPAPPVDGVRIYVWDTDPSYGYDCSNISRDDAVVCREFTGFGESSRVVDDSLCLSNPAVWDMPWPRPPAPSRPKPDASKLKQQCEDPDSNARPIAETVPVGPYKAPHQIGGGDYPQTHMPYPGDPAAVCTTRSYRQVQVSCTVDGAGVDISECTLPSGVTASDDGTYWIAGGAVTSGCTYEWRTELARYAPQFCEVEETYDSYCTNTNSQFGYIPAYDSYSSGVSGYDNLVAKARCQAPQPDMYKIIPGASLNTGFCTPRRVLGPWRPTEQGCGMVPAERKSRCELPNGKIEDFGSTTCGYDGEQKTGMMMSTSGCSPSTGDPDSGQYAWRTTEFLYETDFFECGDNVARRNVTCNDTGSGREVAESRCTGIKPVTSINHFKACPYSGSPYQQPR